MANVLYWSVGTSVDQAYLGGKVLRVPLTATYHLQAGSLGEPLSVPALYGFTFYGAAVEPGTGKIYTYRRHPFFFYELHEWNPATPDIPPRTLGDIARANADPTAKSGIGVLKLWYYLAAEVFRTVTPELLIPSSPRLVCVLTCLFLKIPDYFETGYILIFKERYVLHVSTFRSLL